MRLLTVDKDGEPIPSHDSPFGCENGIGIYRPPKVKLVFKAVNFPLEHHVQVQDGACVENKMFIIDKSNHWAKAYDLGTGRYLYISHRQVVKNPYRLCALSLDHKLVLMELKSADTAQNSSGSSSSVNGNGSLGSNGSSNGSCLSGAPVNPMTALRFLSIVNLDLKKKEPFVPEVEGTIWDVATSLTTGLMYLVMKPGLLYKQTERRSAKFDFMFEISLTQPISKIAVCPVTGNIAVATSIGDGKICVYDSDGTLLWKYPDGVKVNFKRLQSIGYDMLGNLLAVDNYYQQVQIISKRGTMLKMLHGRGLKFTNPLCTVPINADELAILAESGDVVVVDSYIKPNWFTIITGKCFCISNSTLGYYYVGNGLRAFEVQLIDDLCFKFYTLTLKCWLKTETWNVIACCCSLPWIMQLVYKYCTYVWPFINFEPLLSERNEIPCSTNRITIWLTFCMSILRWCFLPKTNLKFSCYMFVEKNDNVMMMMIRTCHVPFWAKILPTFAPLFQ